MNKLILVAIAAWILYTALRSAPSRGAKLGALLALAAGIGPAGWVVAVHGVSTRLVFGYAVLVFAASVVLKWLLYLKIFSPSIQPRLGPITGSIAHGALSAACEMGAALVALVYLLPNLSTWQAFGFGAGAAAIESVITVIANVHKGIPEGDRIQQQLTELNTSPAWFAALVPFVERIIATTDHIACRGLLASALNLHLIWPVPLAFAAFIATDGFAAYCLKSGWKFADPSVAARLYGVLASVALTVAAAWMYLLP